MSGVNGDASGIKGALKFQARVRVAGGWRQDHGHGANTVSVTNADSVTLLIAAATSYKNYQDVSGDPEAIVKNQIAGALPNGEHLLRRMVFRMLAAHVAAHQKLFRRVELNLGESATP